MGGGVNVRCYLQVTRKELWENFALEHTPTTAELYFKQEEGPDGEAAAHAKH